MASVISGDALPAYSGLYLKPFQMGGLWLAVIMTAPPACRSTMLYVTVGVGAGLSQRNVTTPLPAAVSATVLAKSSEAKPRVEAHHQPPLGQAALLHVPDYPLGAEADVVEGEVFGDDGSPAVGAELDGHGLALLAERVFQ